MLTLSKLLVKTPEDLNNRQGSSSDRIREITTRGRHGSHDSDGTLSGWGSKACNASSTLVESSQTSTKVCRITGVGRHLSETSGNLTKSLCPTGGRVSHHRYVHSLVTEVLGESNTGINRSLTSCHRHVGSVRYKRGTLHDTNFLLGSCLLVLDSHCKLREITQHLSHLVSTLSTTDVHNSVRVRELRQSLTNHSLPTSKSTGDGASTSKHRGEEPVNHTKTRNKRSISGKLLSDGSGTTHGPEVAEFELMSLVLTLVEYIHHIIIDKKSLLSIRSS
mmetsp:Transcript_11056/g.25659  ORF Transcript_11056/g.25659 Transcript_11056/m.25659 type:complete len:277 (-) Transcript_11056:577-1407(-)